MCFISRSDSVITKVLLVQVSAKLYRFEGLGPEFVELAARYRELQQDLDHATFTLQEFKNAAQDQL